MSCSLVEYAERSWPLSEPKHRRAISALLVEPQQSGAFIKHIVPQTHIIIILVCFTKTGVLLFLLRLT